MSLLGSLGARSALFMALTSLREAGLKCSMTEGPNQVPQSGAAQQSLYQVGSTPSSHLNWAGFVNPLADLRREAGSCAWAWGWRVWDKSSCDDENKGSCK